MKVLDIIYQPKCDPLVDVKNISGVLYLKLLDSKQIANFTNLESIELRSKLEFFLSTYLDLRKCSQITIPSDFIDSIELGKQIDEKIQSQIVKLTQITDPKIKGMGIQAIHKALEKHFEEIVEESESYNLHTQWADRFHLKSYQVKMRPTVHEIYHYTDRNTRKKIAQISKDRLIIRKKNFNDPEARKNNIKYAFPEEFDGKWLTKVGALLEYPECCVKHYAKGRIQGINVEARATQQLLDSLKEGEVNAHAYYIGNFLPHDPHCPKAIELGYKWEEKLTEFNEELGKLYSQTLLNNVELILRQPELVSIYLSHFKINLQDTSKPENLD